MTVSKSIPNTSKEDIESLVNELNRSTWFKKEFACIDFVVAVWYHYCKGPIFPFQEKIEKAHEVINGVVKYFIYLSMYEDEISQDQIEKLPNLTILLQAAHKRAIPLHGSMLLTDQNDKKYIMEKDGQKSQITIVPLSEWKTYHDVYPTYSAHTLGSAERLF